MFTTICTTLLLMWATGKLQSIADNTARTAAEARRNRR